MKDITNIDDIKLLVDSFYDKVKQDTYIGPVFHGVIQDNWPAHLDKMYRFWQTILLDQHTYSGSPFLPHASMAIEHVHFDRWTTLFNQTVDSLFVGDIANDAKWRAAKMAEMFEHKINHFKQIGQRPLL